MHYKSDILLNETIAAAVLIYVATASPRSYIERLNVRFIFMFKL